MKTFLAFVGTLVLITAIVAGIAFAAPIVGVWFNDVNRTITRHSRGYIETQTQILDGLIRDYNSPQATIGQQQAIVNDFCYKVTLLLPEERPRNIVEFEQEHC